MGGARETAPHPTVPGTPPPEGDRVSTAPRGRDPALGSSTISLVASFTSVNHSIFLFLLPPSYFWCIPSTLRHRSLPPKYFSMQITYRAGGWFTILKGLLKCITTGRFWTDLCKHPVGQCSHVPDRTLGNQDPGVPIPLFSLHS